MYIRGLLEALNRRELTIKEGESYDSRSFSELRHVKLHLPGSCVYEPFVNCSFSLPVRITILEGSGTLILPETLVVTSVTNLGYSPCTISVNSVERELLPSDRLIVEKELNVKGRYGDSTRDLLEPFSELFSVDDPEFAHPVDEFVTEPFTVDVESKGEKLGTVNLSIDDSDFSLAVMNASGSSLLFEGNIPEDWSGKASSYCLERFSQIDDLTVKGGVFSGGLSGVKLSLDSLTIDGFLSDFAFQGSSGTIQELTVDTVRRHSFCSSSLNIGRLTVTSVDLEAALKAETISLLDSSQMNAVEKALTVIIRESFSEPIVNGVVTKIDLSSVETPGPYSINGSPVEGGQLFIPIYSTVQSRQEIFDLLEERFTDDLSPTLIDRDGVVQALESGQTVGYFTIREETQWATYVLVASVACLITKLLL